MRSKRWREVSMSCRRAPISRGESPSARADGRRPHAVLVGDHRLRSVEMGGRQRPGNGARRDRRPARCRQSTAARMARGARAISADRCSRGDVGSSLIGTDYTRRPASLPSPNGAYLGNGGNVPSIPTPAGDRSPASSTRGSKAPANKPDATSSTSNTVHEAGRQRRGPVDWLRFASRSDYVEAERLPPDRPLAAPVAAVTVRDLAPRASGRAPPDTACWFPPAAVRTSCARSV